MDACSGGEYTPYTCQLSLGWWSGASEGMG